jgi:hypothetical protein
MTSDKEGFIMNGPAALSFSSETVSSLGSLFGYFLGKIGLRPSSGFENTALLRSHLRIGRKPQMKLVHVNAATLAGLLICALTVHGEQGSNDVEQRVTNILNQMTLAEKLSYIGGTGFWDIKPIPRLGLPQIFMENGPLGIAHQPFEPTTRYPAGLAVAATWNRDRARGRGRQIGQDARARGFYADLGPGIDFYPYPLRRARLRI